MNLASYCLNLKNELKIFILSADWIPFLSQKVYSSPDLISENPICNLPPDH
jgi:hypothetical protein